MTGFDPATLAALSASLAGAAVCGGIVGAQRQLTGKAAGLRTHILVAVGACAFTEISRLSGDMRIAAGIITGVGFLGAGAIIRDGAVPHGLTTAASIWCSAAIGLALGFGGWNATGLAVVTTFLVLVALLVSDSSVERLLPQHEFLTVRITFDADALSLEAVLGLLTSDGVQVKKSPVVSIAREGTNRFAQWTITLRSKHESRLRAALFDLSKNPSIRAVDVEGVSRR